MDLSEAEDIKKRWQEYTEELYKKDLYNPDNHHGVVTHLDQTSWNGVVSVQFSRSVVSDFLRPHESQHVTYHVLCHLVTTQFPPFHAFSISVSSVPEDLAAQLLKYHR